MANIIEQDSPGNAFKRFMQLLMERDGEGSWKLLSKISQEQFSFAAAIIGGFAESFTEGVKEAFGADSNTEPDPLAGMSDGKTFWVTIITEGKEEGNPADKLRGSTVVSETISGETAVIIIRDKAGKEDSVDIIFEEGLWKVNLAPNQENA